MSRIDPKSHLPPWKCCHRCSRRSSQIPCKPSQRLVLKVGGSTMCPGLCDALCAFNRQLGGHFHDHSLGNDMTLPRGCSQKTASSEKTNTLPQTFSQSDREGSAADLRHSHTLSNTAIMLARPSRRAPANHFATLCWPAKRGKLSGSELQGAKTCAEKSFEANLYCGQKQERETYKTPLSSQASSRPCAARCIYCQGHSRSEDAVRKASI